MKKLFHSEQKTAVGLNSFLNFLGVFNLFSKLDQQYFEINFQIPNQNKAKPNKIK